MSAVLYLRVSTEEQAKEGVGLNAQLDTCTKHCERQGWAVAGVHRDEGVSGSKGLAERPGLLQAISALSRGDVLVVAKRDRLGRLEPMQMAMIEADVKRRGARIVSAAGEGTESDSPDAILMRRIVDAFSEYERLICIARTTAGLAAKQKRGERTGGIPYGWDLGPDGKNLVPNPAETEVRVLIKELHDEGLSTHKIAARLTNDGIKTKSGNQKWMPSTVNALLKRM